MHRMVNGSIEASAASTSLIHQNPALHDSQLSPISRPASYTNFSFPNGRPPGGYLRRSFSENVLAHKASDISRDKISALNRNAAENKSEKNPTIDGSEAVTHGGEPTSSSEQTAGSQTKAMEDNEPVIYGPQAKQASREKLRRSISGSISKFKRRSWIAASRSPSPAPRKRTIEYTPQNHGLYPSSTDTASVASLGPATASQRENASRGHSFLGRKERRQSNILYANGKEDHSDWRVPIPKSASADRLPSLHHSKSDDGTPAVPWAPSLERLHGSGTESPRRKDELWGAFRTIDGEFQKFQSRPSSTKTSVLRSALLPFLRTYADHSSISSLRAEDLDRRAVILNKWWTGLLEMLNGRHGESVSGNDRPAVLEATTAIMVRREWIASPPRPTKTVKSSLKSRSTTSLGSNMSDFLTDSVQHNVRNMFTQNLLAQMAYVVDKMSARNVPASVVTFCGKATAYAFFYCEGVAEILVRLWNISSRSLRRIVPLDTERSMSQRKDAERAVSAFPPCIHPLSFKTVKATMTYLRARPHVSIAAMSIPWHSPWVTKWAGQDTDLFYIFIKVFVDLASRLLPDDGVAKLAAPGWAIVLAQLLTVLERTLQRLDDHSAAEQLRRPLPITFDGILGDADATVATSPLRDASPHRSMAENRLIMLLRDSLSSSNIMEDNAQRTFADTIVSLLKTAASGTSIFDHQACFTLCDFLDEAFPILHRFQQHSNFTVLIDRPFWFDVFRLLLESHNSMTEVRLFAFIFGRWSILTSDDESKRELCLGWLLSRTTFERQFNHWCPMIRAFYMRLCIWRIARLDAAKSPLNAEILSTLRLRLEETWNSYLQLQNVRTKQTSSTISTAPCSPAPRRCLKIMRDDLQPASSGMFSSFDTSCSSSPLKSPPTHERRTLREIDLQDSSTAAPQLPAGKGLGALLRGLLSFSGSSDHDGKRESSDYVGTVQEGPPKQNDKPMTGHSSKVEDTGPLDTQPSHITFSFKFSLGRLDETTSPFGKETKLLPPQMPLPAQLSREQWFTDRAPQASKEAMPSQSKTIGRALAEWAASTAECENFFRRRQAEGVPTYRLVETPMLDVDPFRRS